MTRAKGTGGVAAMVLLVAATALAGPERAEAQAITAGQWRVGAGLGVLDVTLDPDLDEDALGVALGLTNLSTGLTVGYQLTDAILVGTRLWTFYDKPRGASTEEDTFNLLVTPYFHYMFLEGLLRPFVGAEIGGGVVTKTASRDRRGILLVGALAGLHYFLSYTAAISPWLEVAYERRTNVNTNLLRFALFLTVSIWFGGPSGFRGQASAPRGPALGL